MPVVLSRIEEQGMPAACCTRDLVCHVDEEVCTRAYRYSRSTPAFPAQWCFRSHEVQDDDPRSSPPTPYANDRLPAPSWRSRRPAERIPLSVRRDPSPQSDNRSPQKSKAMVVGQDRSRDFASIRNASLSGASIARSTTSTGRCTTTIARR